VSLSICSSDFPFVSGIIYYQKQQNHIIGAEERKVLPPPNFSASIGNVNAIIAAINQCVKLLSV